MKSLFFWAILGTLVFSHNSISHAQTNISLEAQVVGRTETIDIVVTSSELNDQGPIWWQQSFNKLGANYMRFFIRLSGEASDGARVIVEGLSDVQFSYTTDDFLDGGLWTGLLPKGRAQISLRADDRPDNVKLSIDQITYQTPTGLIFSPYGEDQITHINESDVPHNVRQLAPPVAKLAFQRDGKPRSCTGFLLDKNTLLTNEHCINSKQTCQSLAAVFDYEIGEDDRIKFGKQFFCEALNPNYVNYELDATLITLHGEPGNIYGWVAFGTHDADEQEPLVIIQHPGGHPKQVSIDECAALAVNVDGRGNETDFSHTCDTAGGSSGAPVFNRHGKVVGLHHYGFNETSTENWTENRAVRFSKLLTWLNQLGWKAK